MKAIELTQEHRIKLLEMCNILFSEYKKYNQQEDNSGNWLQDKIWFEINNKLTGIHWFEFCMTHLAKKLLKNNYFKLTSFANRVLFKNNHPIEILYIEFKKLKLN